MASRSIDSSGLSSRRLTAGLRRQVVRLDHAGTPVLHDLAQYW